MSFVEPIGHISYRVRLHPERLARSHVGLARACPDEAIRPELGRVQPRYSWAYVPGKDSGTLIARPVREGEPCPGCGQGQLHPWAGPDDHEQIWICTRPGCAFMMQMPLGGAPPNPLAVAFWLNWPLATHFAS